MLKVIFRLYKPWTKLNVLLTVFTFLYIECDIISALCLNILRSVSFAQDSPVQRSHGTSVNAKFPLFTGDINFLAWFLMIGVVRKWLVYDTVLPGLGVTFLFRWVVLLLNLQSHCFSHILFSGTFKSLRMVARWIHLWAEKHKVSHFVHQVEFALGVNHFDCNFCVFSLR